MNHAESLGCAASTERHASEKRRLDQRRSPYLAAAIADGKRKTEARIEPSCKPED